MIIDRMGKILYLMSMMKYEETLPLEWCMKACRKYALKHSMYLQDEINVIWHHGEYEVVGNYGSYDEGTMYKWLCGSNMWRKVKDKFVKDVSIVT